MIDYWSQRAESLGARATVNLDHPASRTLSEVTARHRREILPVLGAQLRGDERLVCDVGSGAGRLTADLAALVGGRAIGVEPVAALRALAPASAAVRYRGLDGAALPLEDAEADVAVTVTVLGGLVAPGELDAMALEIRRVLRPGGLVFLAESVSDAAPHEHWAPRAPGVYDDAFAWAGLREVGRFDDAGDPVSLLAGRSPA